MMRNDWPCWRVGPHTPYLGASPSSDKAKALAAAGAEVVTADVDDPAALTRAFQGAHGAYCVTFFWDHFSPAQELATATNMAHAAKAAGVQHVIWSTLEDTRHYIPLDDDRMTRRSTGTTSSTSVRDFETVCNDMRDVERARSFAPGLKSFAQWLGQHGAQIPLE